MKKLLFASLFLLLAVTAFSQENIPMIEVEGKSEISIMPDEAIIHLSLMEKAMKVADVTNALNKKTKSIEDALKKTNVKDYDFTVDNYYVSVNRVYAKGTSRDSGYVASQTIKVRVRNIDKDLVKITESLHQTADMGFNIQFTISDKVRKSSEQKLLELAIADARSKADVIAKSLGIQNIQVHRVNYTSDGNNFYPVMRQSKSMMAMDMAESRQEPTFSPEEQKLSDKVLVSFTFKK
ncbi:SIMPL domain-containing protein [Aquiflexum sp.]|uniref:SIMPL domain-containing protein n=1 Tax=Aquiflexum sp. TaxID=1872584 RepID=UPI003593D8F5